jgi:hypothetical protein
LVVPRDGNLVGLEEALVADGRVEVGVLEQTGRGRLGLGRRKGEKNTAEVVNRKY